MPDISPILDRLARSRAGLEFTVQALPAERWRDAPAPGAWSAAEIIAHLTMVEGAIISRATEIIQKPPLRVPFWRHAHLPVALAEWRGIRRKTPIPLDRAILGEQEAMLAGYADVRRCTLDLLVEARRRNLSAHRFPHPFFGSLNLYQWFHVIGHHEVRHTKQLREIVEIFQKM